MCDIIKSRNTQIPWGFSTSFVWETSHFIKQQEGHDGPKTLNLAKGHNSVIKNSYSPDLSPWEYNLVLKLKDTKVYFSLKLPLPWSFTVSYFVV